MEGNHPIDRVHVVAVEVVDEWLAQLGQLIIDTPELNWLLLTKRPENFWKRLREVGKPVRIWVESCVPPPNVWLGVTVENQEQAYRRMTELAGIPARVRFLSCEPLLGPLNLSGVIRDWWRYIDWVIAGGESGPGARRMDAHWVCDLRDQCGYSQVPFFFKRWGVADRVPKEAERLLCGCEWNEFPFPTLRELNRSANESPLFSATRSHQDAHGPTLDRADPGPMA